ncbi:hypothetical protein diail_11040, partial [Diaporthe ilicicola]
MVRVWSGPRGAGLAGPVAVGFILGSFCVFLTLTHYTRPVIPVSGCDRYLTSGQEACIPPVVHFVQLKKDEASSLHFSFESFLALYAAYHFVQPSIIYIHTDFSPNEVADAATYGSSWTRRVLTAFPKVVRLNKVTAPTQANGLDIKHVEHKSDFVRLDQLVRHGGIYLDWDVLILKPLSPLLNAGFKAVVGRQSDATINNGVILAARDSAVVRIMKQESPKAFDGGWITHSVRLLTTVAQAVAGVPHEVLIMDPGAFAPFSWDQESVNRALERHEGDADEQQSAGMLQAVRVDPMMVWERHRASKTKLWAHDFNDAFFLHNYFNSVENPKGYDGVSVPYVLARDSNYALAAWPIVMQGIKDGYIDAKD